MRTLTRNILLLCLIQCFCTEINAAIGEPSEDKLPRQISVLTSKENLSALKGPAQFRERAQLCRSLDIPFEHISVPIKADFSSSSPTPRFSEVGSLFFENFFSYRRDSSPHLPIKRGAIYEFYFHFSKAGQSFNLENFDTFFCHEFCCCTPPKSLPCGENFDSSLRSKGYKEGEVPDPMTKRFSIKIPSNPFHIIRQLDPRSRFRLCFRWELLPKDSCPDCLEILVHPNIKDFFTGELHRENSRLIRQNQGLSSTLDDTRAELENLKTHVKTLTLQTAAERTFDSVTNTTVSSLRSTQNNTPTNALGDEL